MLEANFWQDKDNSKKIIKEKKLFEDLIDTQKSSIEKLSDLALSCQKLSSSIFLLLLSNLE